ncbi:MAG: exodeoxyribonuclease VII large subunit, partial [Thermoanaerobaculales bacterium]|nr:exodeoxyribonuclease VII large subunit [Thermoanaerobaculales bacterium]
PCRVRNSKAEPGGASNALEATRFGEPPVKDRVYSVAALLSEVNALLEQGFSGVRVEGEATNVNPSGRGHVYFTLKDESAAIDCVMWASKAQRLKFQLEDGLAVLVRGSLTIYAQRGRFQMVVDDVQPQGMGALQLAFEQLKKRLELEGLFAAERKRPLPALPNRVGIVTSASGAALQDMLKVLRRFPFLEVVVAPATVQGAGAAAEIAAAIERLTRSGKVNVVIVGRGGGSLEDLWAFNEEPVARAIAASPVPVISGVGHEVDFTIADFVADIRAATPTQAAEIVVARLEEQERRLSDARQALLRDINRHLRLARAHLRGLAGSSGLARLPQRVRLYRERLRCADRLSPALRWVAESAAARLENANRGLKRLPAKIAAGGHRRLLASRRQQLRQLIDAQTRRQRARIEASRRALDHLGPERVLERGYSITTLEGSTTPIKDATVVHGGQTLTTRLARGRVRSLVSSTSSERLVTAKDPTAQPSLFDDPTQPGSTPGERSDS